MQEVILCLNYKDKKNEAKIVIGHKVIAACDKAADLVITKWDNVAERFNKRIERWDVKIDGWVGDYGGGFRESITIVKLIGWGRLK